MVGIAGSFLGGERSGSWLGPVVNAVLLIVLALLLLTSNQANGADRLAFLGWIAFRRRRNSGAFPQFATNPSRIPR